MVLAFLTRADAARPEQGGRVLEVAGLFELLGEVLDLGVLRSAFGLRDAGPLTGGTGLVAAAFALACASRHKVASRIRSCTRWSRRDRSLWPCHDCTSSVSWKPSSLSTARHAVCSAAVFLASAMSGTFSLKRSSSRRANSENCCTRSWV